MKLFRNRDKDNKSSQEKPSSITLATGDDISDSKKITEVTDAVIAMLKKGGDNGELVLQTDNLVKKYRQRTVANHVSINVRQGEIVGLLGPNGAGKTTTFYMTTGLVTPNEGRVFINNVEITKLPVYRRAQLGIGYLPQEASVFRKLTVENNIRTVLEMTNTSPEYQRDKLEELISEFHLEKVRKNLGDRLSGGERRRTEIARCLAINPRFIMLD
jgi:lipopolysaccharide export system ATP-binding protein